MLKIVMLSLDEDNIEDFIRKNKAKFATYFPPVSHKEKFLFKLNFRFRHIISIVPHLIRVAIATAIIFSASIFTWNNFIRKDRHEITLKNKISLVFNRMYQDGNRRR